MSHVRVLGPRRYQARWTDPSGKPKTKVFHKKSDAERHLTAMEHGKLAGTYVDPDAGKITVRVMADTWMASKVNLKASTRVRYESALAVHVLPRWGNVPLSRVDHESVQAWIAELVASGASPAQVRKVNGVLTSIMSLAVRGKRVPANVCDGLQLPRMTERKRLYLTARQVELLATQAAIPPRGPRSGPGSDYGQYRLVIYVLSYCGLRWGELAALRTGAVDLLRARIQVAASVTEVNGARLVWGTPKSHESRSVPLPRFLVDELAQHLHGKAQDELVFTSPKGDVLRNRNARRAWFDQAATAVGIKGLTPHELRHTAASLAVSAGGNVKAVQRMLGHASAALTLDRYADLFDDDLDALADRLDSVARSAAADQQSFSKSPTVIRL